MRICVIASSSHPVRQPFAGGLEAFTHGLASGLTERGHEVTLFAGDGSDHDLPVDLLPLDEFVPSDASMADANAPSRRWMAEHHAYLGLMLRLGATGELATRFDVVHNTSLHHLPVAMAASAAAPVLTTLHTPPLPWLESALALGRHPTRNRFVAVSAHTARSWSHAVDAGVVHNGVDVRRWRAGHGGGPAVWSGRLVPEKAPHEAIAACRLAGVPLVLVGPVHDLDYVRERVTPRLGGDVTYAGHLDNHELEGLLQEASVAVVTPDWDEPYGLVAAEAMACGTPVAAYARGGLPEVVGPGGVLAAPGDVEALAAAIADAVHLDRAVVRAHAERSCSLDRMLDRYEERYRDLTAGKAVA